jgi:hypothetical protein
MRPLIAVLLAVLFLFLGSYWWLGDFDQAGWLTFLVLVGILYYGHFYKIASIFILGGFSFDKRLLFIIIWLMILVLLAIIPRYSKIEINFSRITLFLNMISLIMIIVPANIVIRFLWNNQGIYKSNPTRPISPDIQYDLEQPPDIYYLILDGYARQDVLQKIYGLDNTDFLDFLSQKGFYVAKEAHSNYMHTFLSVASSLNLDYLDQITRELADYSARAPMTNLIDDSRARAMLENAGYQTISFSSGVFFTEFHDVDAYFTPRYSFLNRFEELLVSNTLFGEIFDFLGLGVNFSGYEAHRERILYTFENLAELPISKKPKFVFAHVIAPHPPFVFDRYGNPIQPDRPYFLGDADGYQGDTEEYLNQYADELMFINTLLVKTITKIIDESDQDPIIIIQADHGPGAFLLWDSSTESCLWERFSILNAYYLPADILDDISEDITPVNSFRVIFDAYFATDLGLLPDRSYFSSWNKPYSFQDVTEAVKSPCNLSKVD